MFDLHVHAQTHMNDDRSTAGPNAANPNATVGNISGLPWDDLVDMWQAPLAANFSRCPDLQSGAAAGTGSDSGSAMVIALARKAEEEEEEEEHEERTASTQARSRPPNRAAP